MIFDVPKDVSIELFAEYVNNQSSAKSPELLFDKIGEKEFLREIRTNTNAFVLSKFSQQAKLEKSGQKAQSHKVSGK